MVTGQSSLVHLSDRHRDFTIYNIYLSSKISCYCIIGCYMQVTDMVLLPVTGKGNQCHHVGDYRCVGIPSTVKLPKLQLRISAFRPAIKNDHNLNCITILSYLLHINTASYRCHNDHRAMSYSIGKQDCWH